MSNAVRLIENDPFFEKWHEAVASAALGLDLGDVPESEDDELMEEAFEERHHCGTCILNFVLEKLEPVIWEFFSNDDGEE